MNKVAVMLLAVFMFAAFTIFGNVYADCGMCGDKSAKEGVIINDTCPVMGGKVNKDTPYKTVYKGKTIGFCCPGCIEKFKANPGKYMAKLKKQCIIECPECGAQIDVMEECKKAKKSGKCPHKKLIS